MSEGLLKQLIQLLADVPSVILLILKTNDLTRSLDENLQTGRGPERTFLIMARYCARTVYQETMETIQLHGGFLRIGNLARWVGAVYYYWRVKLKLRVFESALFWRRVLGLTPP
jgi:aarF domain-containing kinase